MYFILGLNVYFIGFLIVLLINKLLGDGFLSRLLKVVTVPVICIYYIKLYYNSLYDFNDLTSELQVLVIFGPLVLFILVLVIGYVIGGINLDDLKERISRFSLKRFVVGTLKVLLIIIVIGNFVRMFN
ncbi:hypothetical protein SAMN05216225_101341 [Ornithinibacillus halophilus]|uniref:Uncharacterized protein n=1 Tax=Ornithinibacillus halophilus TaxID=930117 RepID=A0A1M5GJU8_9BACI|nr:hypothetical protein SAMN05216225_101341 [Ornithinibacillus halophilus]